MPRNPGLTFLITWCAALAIGANACSDDAGGRDAGDGDTQNVDGGEDVEDDAIADFGTETDGVPATTLLDEPLRAFPERLSDIGLYRALPDCRVTDERAIAYLPRWELWSNGSAKERFLVIPAGEVIDTSDRTAWEFPVGTLLFKTFAYPDSAIPGGQRAVETRLIRRGARGWQLALYQWNEEGTDATRLDMAVPVSVPVETEAQGAFEHEIPSRLQCRTCHEAEPRFVIGVDELRLNSRLEGAAMTQLEALDAAGLLSVPGPDEPAAVVADDPMTEAVIGYVHGNCAHCHNGYQTAQAHFDLRHPVFLEATIDQPTRSSAMVPGIRIVPGDAEESMLFLAVSGEADPELGVLDMPPAGIQVRDSEWVALLRGWIEGLPASE